ncbi:MAG: right-handed parallel beta-helix repeat-containing protein [Planctomycetota bacterium]
MKPIYLASALALATSLSAQSTLLVPQDYASIQSAIATAAPGDTVLVDPGTYNEQLDLLGKAITVRSSAGAAATTIDSQGAQGWLDFPTGAVVRMVSGEGSGTVVQGFTITGGLYGSGYVGGSGVYCDGASPVIRDCVITGNSGGFGGGVAGDARLERCAIVGNDSMPYGNGGGVRGEPTIVQCVISDNRSGGLGGGIYTEGPCTITDSIIDGNLAGNGFDGYSGGGVFGPATLIGTQITGNEAHHWFSGGPPDEIGTGIDGGLTGATLIRCTVADNRIAGGAVPGDNSGGIRNVISVEDSVLWNNENREVAFFSSPAISYSTVMGGYVGAGNLSSDPTFVDAPGGDFQLALGSPAIDAGNPASAPDPDGTTVDMGAYFYPQFVASTAVRNGTGVNPSCYSTATLPVLGSTWTATVDVTAHSFAGTAALIHGYVAPLVPLPLGSLGELLVDSGTALVWSSLENAAGGTTTHTLAVPADPYLAGGFVIYSQAVVLGASLGLCNAIDLTLGM